ncbi:MAG: hypothetical protein C5B46_05660 [Proteobacteria bacterium]|nr:MAG: hypothetical protein C5B46_05660 [Pseudomonadota bacterium]
MLEDRERLAREAVRKAVRNAPFLFSKEGSQRFYRHHMEAQDADVLVALARDGDKDALELLKRYASGARRAGLTVPTALHEFVWEYFIDGAPKAKPGSSPKDIGLKHQTIAVLVKIVSQDYGFPEYRNWEHRGEKTGPRSACLLVAEELGLDEQTVEAVWRERKAAILRTHG